MSRARFALMVIAAVYFGGMIGLAFVPGSAANRASVVWPLVIFVPVGVLLVLLLGRRRWWSAVGFGALGAAWLEAAQSIWMPIGYADAWDVLWATSGVLIGVGGAVIGVTMVRKSMRAHESPRIVTQGGQKETPLRGA
jgi:glycopeptide antibiotics resistance protein